MDESDFTTKLKDSEGPSDKSIKIVLSSTEQPIFKSLLPYFKQQLKLCNTLCTVPFEWDDEEQRMRLLKSKTKVAICKMQMGVQICYSLGMLGYFVTPGSLSSNKTSTKIVAFAFLVCFIATMCMKVIFWIKRSEVVLFINSILNFENAYLPPQRGQVKDIISKALLYLGVATSIGLPGLVFTMLIVNPCKPPHLGYILFKNGLHQCLIPPFSIRLALLTFDAWMWTNSIVPACFFSFPVFFLGLRSFTFYLTLLIRGSKCKASKGFRSESEKDRVCLQFYRHLQLLVNLYNTCLQMVFIPTQISAACLVIIAGLYACIKLHRVIPMPGFAFFPLLSLDGFSMIFISQVGSGIYILSRKFIKSARRSSKYRKSSWYKKTATSCDFIKIRFGATNFFDKMTPLIFINFCLTETVSLILLT